VDSRRALFPLVDLRVDYNPEPLKQLRHLFNLNRAYL